MTNKTIFSILVLLFLPYSLFAKYIYINEDIITPISEQKIEKLGEELYQKTGISLYIAAVKKIKDENFKMFEEKIAKNLKKPYILLAFSRDDYKVDLLMCHKLKNLIDKNSVLIFYGPIIPEFFSDQKDKYSRALFGGYIYIADKLADIYHVKLVTNLGIINKTFYYFFRYTVYVGYIAVFLIFIMFGYRRYKKIMKKNEKRIR